MGQGLGWGLGAHLRIWARVSVTVLQRLSSPSRRLGSSLRNFTASTSTRSTTRILLCRLGNWAVVGEGGQGALQGTPHPPRPPQPPCPDGWVPGSPGCCLSTSPCPSSLPFSCRHWSQPLEPGLGHRDPVGLVAGDTEQVAPGCPPLLHALVPAAQHQPISLLPALPRAPRPSPRPRRVPTTSLPLAA